MKLFGIIASILGFFVDAVTIIGWFLNPEVVTSRIIQIPLVNISLHLEAITLLVLIYTFCLFLFLRFSSPYSSPSTSAVVFTLVSASSLPFFFLWANIFHDFDKTWAVILSFFSVNLFISVVLGYGNLSILNGFFLSPLAAAWLHEQYRYEWIKSFGAGLLLGNSGLLLILILVVVAMFFILAFRLTKKLFSKRSKNHATST